MRYWVYKDAQIVGPVDREQLSTAVGLRADTLVCPDDGGGRENDWRLAEDCPELSGLYYTGARAPSADMPLEEFGLLERLQFESGGAGEAEDWLGALFQGMPVTDLKESKHEADGRLAVALKESQERVRELTEQVARLTRRLEQLEAGPRHMAAAPPPLAAAAPPPVQAAPPVEVVPPASAPALPELPSFAPPAPAEPPKEEEVLVIDETPAPVLPEAKAPAAEPPAPELPAVSSETPAEADGGGFATPKEAPAPENPNLLKLGTPVKKGVQLGAAKSFKTVKREPAAAPPGVLPAAPAPAAIVSPPAPMPTPAPSLPPMPTLQPAPSLPPVTDTPLSAPPPPVTGWSTVAPATPMFGQPSTPAPLEAPPVPAPLEPPPLPVPPVPTTDAPPATLVGRASGVPQGAAPGPATKEVLARLAKPAPKPEAAAPAPGASRPNSNKVFFIVAIVGILAFGVVGWLFLRNPTEVQQAVDMAPDAPLPEDETAAPAPIPMAQVQAPPPVPQPQRQAAPEPPVMQDQGPAAIELVKSYPLDGDRGTVGQWLAYSFMSAPGGQDKWDAGAVEETAYLVQYTVLPKGRDAITYLFEADVARGTVMGKNPASRELLAGSSRPQVKKAPAKKRARPKRSAPVKTETKLLPQLPLPSDTELLPPSEDDGAFRSDAVEPGL